MDHILYSNIISHLEANNILSENQHGFRKHRSCESQLSITLQEFADGLNSGDQMECILLDFSKGFDKVPHQRLLKVWKVYIILVECNIHKLFFTDFLLQCIVLN
jgi:hypothetical protein